MKRFFPPLLALTLLLGCRPFASAALPPEGTPAAPAAQATATPLGIEVTVRPPGPTVTPPPTPSPGPAGDPGRPMVALTFDDGPTEYTGEVLDLLERYGARGTFFVIGTSLSDDTRALLQRMADLGCDIGMHDINHTDLTKLSAAANVRRIERMRGLISGQIAGGYDTHLMRPPYGSLNKAVRRACRAGSVACIRWSVDTRDWSNKDPRAILRIVKQETRDGAILLFHDRLPTTVTALKEVIPWLQEQGYELVTVTELIESSGQSLRYGEDYHRKPNT